LNKKHTLSLGMILIVVIMLAASCATNKTKVPVKTNPGRTHQETKQHNSSTEAAVGAAAMYKFNISSMPINSIIDMNTPWETSPNGELEATIEGKGEKAQEEGYSSIIFKDIKTGVLTKLSLENEEKYQITAKDLEWIDSSTMFVIMGDPFGTVSMGGKIYKLNINNGEVYLYKDTNNPKEEYTTVIKAGNTFKFDKYVYDDANFTTGHIERGILK
jgi:hypothetical protein